MHIQVYSQQLPTLGWRKRPTTYETKGSTAASPTNRDRAITDATSLGVGVTNGVNKLREIVREFFKDTTILYLPTQ